MGKKVAAQQQQRQLPIIVVVIIIATIDNRLQWLNVLKRLTRVRNYFEKNTVCLDY